MNALDFCKKATEYKLIRASSGNVSFRNKSKSIDGIDTIYITKSGQWIEDVKFYQDFCLMTIDGKVIDQTKPSSESKMHMAIYNISEKINCVFHCQPLYSTIFAAKDFDIMSFKYYTGAFNVIPEIPFYINKIGYVDYFTPGSQELVDSVVEHAIQGCDVIVLKNHGLLVYGDTNEKVMQKTIFFELAAEILNKSKYNTFITQGECDEIKGLRRSV